MKDNKRLDLTRADALANQAKRYTSLAYSKMSRKSLFLSVILIFAVMFMVVLFLGGGRYLTYEEQLFLRELVSSAKLESGTGSTELYVVGRASSRPIGSALSGRKLTFEIVEPLVLRGTSVEVLPLEAPDPSTGEILYRGLVSKIPGTEIIQTDLKLTLTAVEGAPADIDWSSGQF